MPSRRGSRRGEGSVDCGCKSGLGTADVLVAVSDWQPGSLEAWKGPWLFRLYGISKNRAYILHKYEHSLGNKQTSST